MGGERDAREQWDVYESVLKIPYYVTIDPVWERVRWFRHDGARYVEERPGNERLWPAEAGLALGTWRGAYEGREGLWLRFYDAQGALMPTRAEREAQERDAKKAALQAAEQERRAKERERQAKEAALQQADQERAAKEAALQELERLKAQLRALKRTQDKG